jgi:hypothetical protein
MDSSEAQSQFRPRPRSDCAWYAAPTGSAVYRADEADYEPPNGQPDPDDEERERETRAQRRRGCFEPRIAYSAASLSSGYDFGRSQFGDAPARGLATKWLDEHVRSRLPVRTFSTYAAFGSYLVSAREGVFGDRAISARSCCAPMSIAISGGPLLARGLGRADGSDRAGAPAAAAPAAFRPEMYPAYSPRVEAWDVWYALQFCRVNMLKNEIAVVVEDAQPMHLFVELCVQCDATTDKGARDVVESLSVALARFLHRAGRRTGTECMQDVSHMIALESVRDSGGSGGSGGSGDSSTSHTILAHFPSIVFSARPELTCFVDAFGTALRASRDSIDSDLSDCIRWSRYAAEVLQLPLPYGRDERTENGLRARFMVLPDADADRNEPFARRAVPVPDAVAMLACCPNHALMGAGVSDLPPQMPRPAPTRNESDFQKAWLVPMRRSALDAVYGPVARVEA